MGPGAISLVGIGVLVARTAALIVTAFQAPGLGRHPLLRHRQPPRVLALRTERALALQLQVEEVGVYMMPAYDESLQFTAHDTGSAGRTIDKSWIQIHLRPPSPRMTSTVDDGIHIS
jgi:hypothetical protein|eukprot:COSAG02_NODE_17849_length_976_cov_1.183580_2_plen_117_part_00